MESETHSKEGSIFTELHEQFEDYKKHFKSKQATADAKEDDATALEETETKCKALLQKMQQSVNKKLENVESSEPEFPRLLALKCALAYEEGRALTLFGDEEFGLKTMAEALQLSVRHRHRPEFSYLVLKICNTSSYLESRREKYEEAYDILEEARAIYHQITDENVVDFYTIDELFSEDVVIVPKAETKTLLERLVTNNLQILSFVCNKLDRAEDYFKYTHEVLERQLRDGENEPLLWAMKAGRLAFGFMSHTRFWEARNHLSAAYHILKNYSEELKKTVEDAEGTANKNEKLKHTEADMAKLWVKYCLYLLSASKKRLISTFYTEANDVVDNMWLPTKGINEEAAGDEGTIIATESPPEAANSEASSNKVENEKDKSEQPNDESSDNLEMTEEVEKNEEECLSTNEIKIDEDDVSSQCKEDEQKEIPLEGLLLFTTLDLADVEKQVTADLVETTEQARAVVTFAHAWLRRSKIYYNIGQYPTEYINSILDLSDLYRYLAFFEDDLENQYMVQKSRADALETLNMTLRELRPPCHLTITIELLRELAEVQLELVGLNLRRLFSLKGTYEEGDSELCPSDVLQKMGALADLHGRLEHFGDSFAFITQPFQGFYEARNETLQQCI